MRWKLFFWIGLLVGSGNLAQANDLAYSKEWLNLLHYKSAFGGGYEGLVANNDFYLSPKGKTNPQAELTQEIKDFASGSKKCNFPARFSLLKENGLVQGNLKECSEYLQFMNDVQPKGITILFTNAYMSNPASLFGHTLIRIDTERKGTQMLAHGSNFGANAENEYGFLFAIKGLVGGYDGIYNVSPYWQIINTYNNLENRDIWEYTLNLSEAEKIKFVNHLYEMQKAKIQYYFLNKNCSYMILELLDAVRPSLNLSKNYNLYAIPLDTLKTINAVPNLVGEVNYRPSRYSKIKHQIKQMNSQQYRAFEQSIKKQNYNLNELNADEQAEVLETAYEYYQYQYVVKELELKKYRQKSFAVLQKRSGLPKIIEKDDIKGENPLFSHNSTQIALGGGVYNHHSFEQLGLRPAYTSLSDNSFGLVKGAEIEVLSSVWRYYNQSHKTVLQKFVPLKIKSLVPVNQIFLPVSYSVDFEIKRQYNPQTQKEGTVASAITGVGQSYEIWKGAYAYGLMKIGGEYGGFIPHNQFIGLLPEVGIWQDFGRLRLNTNIEKTFATHKFGERLKYNAVASFGLTINWSLDVSYESSRNLGYNQEEWLLQTKYSF